MSYAPTPAAPGTYSIYSQQSNLSGYSSSSDIEGTNNSIADYSDHEGYSSTASNSFSFTNFRPSQRMGPAPAFAQSRYNATSQSPPPAQQFAGMSTPAIHQQPLGGHRSTDSVSPVSQTSVGLAAMVVDQGGEQQQQQYQRIARFVGPPPVALACTECRSRHLKCDAGMPVCSRCLADKRDCRYVKSRRGWKGTRRKKVQQAATAGTGDKNDIGHVTEAPLQSGTDTEGPDGGYSSGKRYLNPRVWCFCRYASFSNAESNGVSQSCRIEAHPWAWCTFYNFLYIRSQTVEANSVLLSSPLTSVPSPTGTIHSQPDRLREGIGDSFLFNLRERSWWSKRPA